MQKNNPLEEGDLDQESMWKKACVDKKGEFENEEVREIVNRIVRHYNFSFCNVFKFYQLKLYCFFTFVG